MKNITMDFDTYEEEMSAERRKGRVQGQGRIMTAWIEFVKGDKNEAVSILCEEFEDNDSGLKMALQHLGLEETAKEMFSS